MRYWALGVVQRSGQGGGLAAIALQVVVNNCSFHYMKSSVMFSRVIALKTFLTASFCYLSLICCAVVSAAEGDAPAGGPAPSKFEAAIAGAKKAEGLWTIYHKDQQVLVDLKANQLDKDYVVLSSIARGISAGLVIGGMTWGDDVIWNFRKVGDKMHVIRKNVRFKAKPGSPEANAVKLAYSDSVLYALPIVADTTGGHLVDMTRVFFSDDEQIGRSLGAKFEYDRSTIAKVKAFDSNVQLQVAAVYSGNTNLDTVPDPRGLMVQVHYSISTLPQTGYKPRKADDRVGYFLAVTKDFSENLDDRHFVRYITRWDLQKLDAGAKLSPPKDPVIFYLERTLPVHLRPIVRSGIEEWNKAFEKLGFANAIEVRQQRDEDTWDPEDVKYNTFRWITAEAGFAMGPSRVNPMTGQILDADIIFDASFLRFWSEEYELYTPAKAISLVTDAVFGREQTDVAAVQPYGGQNVASADCLMSRGMQQQLGFAAASLAAQGKLGMRKELPEEFVAQALKEVVMHEVGHTLGLRHNFKASAWKSLKDIEDPTKSNEATVASVMDYSPVNIAPPEGTQGAYYTPTLGPYDYWAIEYGYKPFSGEDGPELAKIAARSGEPGLDYATDEDTRSVDSDPFSNRFDLGSDPIAYAQRQIATVNLLVPKIVERSVEPGEGYQKARQSFGMLLSEYWRTVLFASRLPGGLQVARDHKGDAAGRAPFKVVDAAQQRAAMQLIGATAFQSPKIDASILNYLAATRWSHWGITEPLRVDLAVHDVISNMQARTVSQLLDPLTLSRLQDSEMRTPADQDLYSLAEHLRTLVNLVFTEILEPKAGEYGARTPYVDGIRRNLHRTVVRQFSNMLTRVGGVPEDARVLARAHLTDLSTKIDGLLANEGVKLDEVSLAHMRDLKQRVEIVLKAELALPPVN